MTERRAGFDWGGNLHFVGYFDDEEDAEFASLRSGVMAGAPLLSSRDIDGGIVPVMDDNWAKLDTKTIGLAVPLAKLSATDADWRALTAAATAAHTKLTAEGRVGAIKPDRRTAGVDWQFTAADARTRLKQLYPVIQPVTSGVADH